MNKINDFRTNVFKYKVNGKKYSDVIIDIAQYKQACDSNFDEYIREKFIYKQYGWNHKNSISFIRYMNETDNVFDELYHVLMNSYSDKIVKIYNAIKNIANRYELWCVENHAKDIVGINPADLNKFIVGVLGEIFWYYFLQEKCIIKVDRNGQHIEYRFDNICFMNNVENPFEFGVDLIAEVITNGKAASKRNCVIQLKCWNPNSNENIIAIKDILQPLREYGMTKHIISANDTMKNSFVCWLGDENKVSTYVQYYPELKDSMEVFGKEMFMQNEDQFAWEHIAKNFENLKKMFQ